MSGEGGAETSEGAEPSKAAEPSEGAESSEAAEPVDRAIARVARTVAEEAGILVREAFGTAFRVESKSAPHDLVTEVDQAAEQLITQRLLAAYPGSSVLGEEFGASDGEPGAIRWIIDPIDGTNNFVVGMPYFGVSIGAEVDGELVAGAVHDPIHHETFWASRDQAWLNDAPLPDAGEDPGHPGLMTSLPFQGLQPHESDAHAFVDLLREFVVVRNPGSFALQIAHVAAGRAGAAAEITGAAPWDIAGGFAVAQAAGCTIIKLLPATPGYGEWGSHSYLVMRDPNLAASIAPRVQELIERGEVPERFAAFVAASIAATR